MARTEFTRATKRQALERSGYRCEATGSRYGFEDGQRCNCDLSLGVQFDHNIPCELSGGNSLQNCMALCIKCHKWKTRNDVKQIAKSNRERDKHSGVIRPAGKIRSAGFPKAVKERPVSSKAQLPPRPLYREDNQP